MTTQRAILLALEEVFPNALDKRTLLAGANCKSKTPIPPGEMDCELMELVPNEVTKIPDRDKGFLYTITARGRARVA